MGTRNSTIVKSKGIVKVAQYGQWDGYPTGQGETIAEFLKTVDLEGFKKKVDALGVWTDEEIDEIVQGNAQCLIGANTNWATEHPELNRDTAAGILQLIADGKVTKVRLDEEFKNDTLFCEFWYELDLDAETVTMNGETFTFKQWVVDGFMGELENPEEEDE